jgi:hypothetical protein
MFHFLFERLQPCLQASTRPEARSLC